MTCDNCLSNDVCGRKYDYIQEEWQYGELIAQDYREDIENICGFFKDKSKFIELPCKVGDKVEIEGNEYRCIGFSIAPPCNTVNLINEKNKLYQPNFDDFKAEAKLKELNE